MGVLIGLLLLVSSSLGATYLATSSSFSGTPYPWLFLALPLLLALVAGCSQKRVREEIVERLRGKGLDVTKGFFVAVALYGATYAFARIVCPPGSPRSIWLISLYGQLGDPKTIQSHEYLVPVSLFALVFLEETVWRGLVTIALEERIGSRFAWVFSALLYAAVQLPTLVTLRVLSLNPLMVITALALGLVFGAIAKRSGRLLLGIFAHALYVWAVVASFPLWTLPGAK